MLVIEKPVLEEYQMLKFVDYDSKKSNKIDLIRFVIKSKTNRWPKTKIEYKSIPVLDWNFESVASIPNWFRSDKSPEPYFGLLLTLTLLSVYVEFPNYSHLMQDESETLMKGVDYSSIWKLSAWIKDTAK